MILTPQVMQEGIFQRWGVFPAELLTGAGATPKPRLRVEIGEHTFWEGRAFRAFYEFSIPVSTTRVIRVTTTKNVEIATQRISLDNGSIRMAAASGGTPGGTWTTVAGQFPVNQMTDTPAYTKTTLIDTGGTHTGGTERDVLRMVSNLQGNSASTIGAGINTTRGIAPGVYYVRLENIGTGTATGVYYLDWSERSV